MVQIDIPPEYGYVVLTASASVILNFWQMSRIGSLRKKLNIQYPSMWSEKHPEFNCAQRAHQNTLEGVPFFLTTVLLAGLRHPQYGSIFGGVWLLGRVVYTLGYSTGDAGKRIPGFMIATFLGQLPLFGLAISTGAGLLGWW